MTPFLYSEVTTEFESSQNHKKGIYNYRSGSNNYKFPDLTPTNKNDDEDGLTEEEFLSTLTKGNENDKSTGSGSDGMSVYR